MRSGRLQLGVGLRRGLRRGRPQHQQRQHEPDDRRPCAEREREVVAAGQRAVACASPCRRSVSRAVGRDRAEHARGRARAEICIDTLTIPDARPASRGGTSRHRDRQQRHERRAAAEADQDERDQQRREVRRVGSPAVASSSEADDQRREARDQRPAVGAEAGRPCARRRRATAPPTASVSGRNASPVLDAPKPRTCSRYSAPKKNTANIPVTSERRARRSSPRGRGRARSRSGMIGFAMRDSSTTNAASSATATPTEPSVCAEPQPYVGRLDDRVDADHQRGGDEHRAERRRRPASSPSPRSRRCSARPSTQRDDPDRDVDEEDPVPVDGLRSARRRRSRPTEPPPTATNMYALIAFARSAGSGNSVTISAMITEEADRAAEPLHEARGDQHAPVVGQPAGDRREREQRDAGEEHALAADQVAEAAGEQQEAAERDQVGVDDPGQVGLREVQIALDRRAARR